MKTGIHPLYVDSVISCACGAKYEVGTNTPDLKIDICSACHPFYTGTNKVMDVEGRVEKFKSKYANVGKNKK
jgi:large subunit ribosomal protein L31